MTFEEILPILLKRKKIRQSHWYKNGFIYFPDNESMLHDEFNNRYDLGIEEYEADNWEEYNEFCYDFKTIFFYLREGRKASRETWKHVEIEQYYIYLKDGRFKDSNNDNFNLSESDLLARDWYIVN